MLDLSPEKIMVLIAIGLVVLGPQRLPHAARTLARGLAQARRLAETLTQPLHDTLAEPRQSTRAVVADLRDALQVPARILDSAGQHQLASGEPDTVADAEPAGEARSYDSTRQRQTAAR